MNKTQFLRKSKFLVKQVKQSWKAYQEVKERIEKEKKSEIKDLNKIYEGVGFLFKQQKTPRISAFDKIAKIISDNCEETGCQDILVCGKKKPTKTKAQKAKTKHFALQQKIDKEFEKVGFKKEYDHTGAFAQFTKPLNSAPFRKALKELFDIKQVVNDITDQEGNINMRHREYVELIKGKFADKAAVRRLKVQLEKLVAVTETVKNIKLTLAYRQEEGHKVTGETVDEFITNLALHFLKYVYSKDTISKMVDQFELIILASKKNVAPLTRGQFMKEMSKTGWFVVNPSTSQHCVSDCFTILEIYRREQLNGGALDAYIKNKGNVFAAKHKIQKGCPVEKLKELAEEYKVDVVFDLYEEKELWDRDAYLIVIGGHCMIAMHPENPRSGKIHDMLKRWQSSKQKPMEKWEPSDKYVKIVSFDFEWFVKEQLQVPYAFGIYTKGVAAEIEYQKHLETTNIYNEFIEKMLVVCDGHFKQYLKDKKEFEENNAKKKFHQTLYLHFIAYGGHRADYPLIEKALLQCEKIERISESQSAQAKISYTYKVVYGEMGEHDVQIVFIDAMNIIPDQSWSLGDFGKAMGLSVEKQEVNHNLINEQNYTQQIIDQKIDYYLECDCKVLYEGIMKWDQICEKQTGFSFIRNRCFTTPSIIQKVFFKDDYKEVIYQQSPEQQEYCRRAYKGGMNENFERGEFTNVISIDINSSYPYQMMKAPFPAGKERRIIINAEYTGGPLYEGIYRILVLHTPNTQYPILCDIIDGKLTFAIFKNYELYVTKEELVAAFDEGYKMHIFDGEVCDYTAHYFKDFIIKAYNTRKVYKKQAKEAKNRGDNDEFRYYEALQLLEKLKMNSLYGKFGWGEDHEVVNYIVADIEYLLAQFAMGNVYDIKKINERYTAYSGKVQSSTSKTNFMIAAYITARARLQLIDAIKQFDKAGFRPLYCDTDSIYAQETENSDYSKIQHLINDQEIGGFKLEMNENIDEDYAIGCFVAPKLYALKGMRKGKEKIKARGVMRWLFDDSKERYAKRREEEGVEQVKYSDIAAMLQNKPLLVKRQQQYIKKSLLTSSADNIKIQKECNSQVLGTVTKRIAANSGICKPKHCHGNITIPEKEERNEDNYLIFPNILAIESYYNGIFDDIASKYCIFRQEQSNQYIVFQNPGSIDEYVVENNMEKKLHQMFGKYIIPCFDIDYQIDEETVNDPKLDEQMIEKIANKLEVGAEKLIVTNRCREDKVSYHVRAPNYIIDRLENYEIAQKLREEDAMNDKMSILSYIDLNIYRQKGSLRVSENNIYYKEAMPIIRTMNTKMLQKIHEGKQNKIEKVGKYGQEQVQNIANQYLQQNGIKGWEYRDCRIYPKFTMVNFKRLHGANSYCTICKKNHDKDNYLTLRMTATKTEVGCIKAQMYKQ